MHIITGTLDDYKALARTHYRAAAPQAPALVLVARTSGPCPLPAAVLVITHPALNAAWRNHAWPDWLTGLSPRLRAREINTTLRTIARVIVHPRHRGAGLATALIRHYLAAPLTPKTEALAAMAALCPLFIAAGMRPVPVPPRRGTIAILHHLNTAGIKPWMLADPRVRIAAADDAPLIAQLRTWANNSRATRRYKDLPAPALVDALFTHLASRPHAFVFDTGGTVKPALGLDSVGTRPRGTSLSSSEQLDSATHFGGAA